MGSDFVAGFVGLSRPRGGSLSGAPPRLGEGPRDEGPPPEDEGPGGACEISENSSKFAPSKPPSSP